MEVTTTALLGGTKTIGLISAEIRFKRNILSAFLPKSRWFPASERMQRSLGSLAWDLTEWLWTLQMIWSNTKMIARKTFRTSSWVKQTRQRCSSWDRIHAFFQILQNAWSCGVSASCLWLFCNLQAESASQTAQVRLPFDSRSYCKNRTPQFLIHSHKKHAPMGGIETIPTLRSQVSALQAENRRLDALLQDARETVGIKRFGVSNRISPQAGGFLGAFAFFYIYIYRTSISHPFWRLDDSDTYPFKSFSVFAGSTSWIGKQIMSQEASKQKEDIKKALSRAILFFCFGQSSGLNESLGGS